MLYISYFLLFCSLVTSRLVSTGCLSGCHWSSWGYCCHDPCPIVAQPIISGEVGQRAIYRQWHGNKITKLWRCGSVWLFWTCFAFYMFKYDIPKQMINVTEWLSVQQELQWQCLVLDALNIYRVLDKDLNGLKVLEIYVDSINSEKGTEKEQQRKSRIMKH